MKKIYQYNNDMVNNNFIIKDQKDLSQEKAKPLRRSIKIKKTKINSKHSMDLSLFNGDNSTKFNQFFQLLNSNNNSFVNYDNNKEINYNLDIYNNNFKVNNYLKITNQKHSMESVEWMYYNNLSKNLLFNQENFLNKQNNNFHPFNSFKNQNSFKKKIKFPTLFVNNKRRLIKTDKNKSTLNRNRIVINVRDKKKFENINHIEEDKLIINSIRKRKLIQYHFLSESGNHKGVKKINQDCYFTLNNINDCDNISIFGILNGHGPYGDKLSKEISEYFSSYFTQKINFNTTENIISPKIDIKKLTIIASKKSISPMITINKKNDCKIQRLKLITNSNKTNQKMNDIYEFMSKDNFSKIFKSFEEIDKELHEKYNQNKKCDDSGTSLNLMIIFNSNSLNKIISTNLGNTKTILITDDKKIKELNIIHTPCIKEERLRVEEHGGVIDRIDWLKVGPLRVWFKGKKYPGLTITRSLGDFEAIPLGIIPVPDIKEYDIDEEKIKILVMATNGVWEFLTNDKIMDLTWQFYESEDAQGATEKIIETAGKIWRIKNPNNIPDLSAGVFFFNK
jgi:serine/threonine protein phosphatase PrpC